jgi:hypothetical protein
MTGQETGVELYSASGQPLGTAPFNAPLTVLPGLTQLTVPWGNRTATVPAYQIVTPAGPEFVQSGDVSLSSLPPIQ